MQPLYDFWNDSRDRAFAQCNPGPSNNGNGNGNGSGNLQFKTGSTVFAVVISFGVSFGIIVSGALLYFRTKDVSIAEASTLFSFRMSVLRIILGAIGSFSSFAIITSILTLASGAIGVATLKSLEHASAVSHGRMASCSQPLHAANLAIAAIAFAVFEMILYSVIFSLVVNTWLYDVAIGGTSAFLPGAAAAL